MLQVAVVETSPHTTMATKEVELGGMELGVETLGTEGGVESRV
jgi:hypothetical protein